MSSLNFIAFKPYPDFAAIIRHMITFTPPAIMPKLEKEKTELILLERKIFARNFKKARKEAGLKQREIEKMTGLTQSFISEVENAVSAISLDNAKRLADAVKKPLWKLLSPTEK